MNSTKSNTLSGLKFALLIIGGVALSGCSGEPSGSEISAAMDAQSKIDAPVLALTGVEILSGKKIGCKEVGEKAYKCDVEVTMKVRGETKTSPGSLRFVKTSDGWRVTR